ncbi:acyl-CoA thioesterase 8 [Plakobranchus ocellatus]|uniref:Acyl-CoA thioesterase 8 n=1 Tax=Plakobranchus ocellatus TaxID=259542 RepID=A0AAV4BYY4_9GAST|nr:acyl-CoA thioesterase 8 [Plakobranchus ocellatus]
MSNKDQGAQNAEESEMEMDKNLGNFIQKSFLDLEKIDDFMYRSKNLWKGKVARAAYGGQVVGQALIAASECIPPDCHMHSMHSYFLRPGDTTRPILYLVDVTREGRTYCSTSVKAIQANIPIFTMQASFKREEEFHSDYQTSMPDVPMPDELSSPVDILEKLREQEIIDPNFYNYRKEWLEEITMMIKFVKEEQIAVSTSQRQTLWIKVKGHLPDGLHPNTHKCCLAYMSDMYLLRTAMMPLTWLHKTRVFATSLDHTMWFHAPLRVDEWLLYDIVIDKLSDGRALVLGRVWDMRGTLVCTIAQEGVLRLPNNIKPKL